MKLIILSDQQTTSRGQSIYCHIRERPAASDQWVVRMGLDTRWQPFRVVQFLIVLQVLVSYLLLNKFDLLYVSYLHYCEVFNQRTQIQIQKQCLIVTFCIANNVKRKEWVMFSVISPFWSDIPLLWLYGSGNVLPIWYNGELGSHSFSLSAKWHSQTKAYYFVHWIPSSVNSILMQNAPLAIPSL